MQIKSARNGCRRARICRLVPVCLFALAFQVQAQPVFDVENAELASLVETANSLREKDPGRAIQLAQEALEKSVSGGDKIAQIYANLVFGRIYDKSGSRDEANRYFSSAITLFLSDDYSSDANLLYYVARAYKFLKKNQEALKYLASGIDLMKTQGNQGYLAIAFNFQSDLYKQLKQYEESKNSALESLKNSEAIGSDKYIFRAYKGIAYAAKKLDDEKLAVEYNQKLLAIAEAQDDKSEIARLLEVLSKDQIAIGDYGNALENAKRAVKNSEAIGNDKYTYRAYKSITYAAKKLDDEKLAIEYNQKLLAIAEAQDDKSEIASLLEVLSKDQIAIGDYANALENAKRAINTLESIEDNERIPGLLMNMSIVYLKLSSYDKALAYALKLFSKEENSPDINAIAAASNQVARVYSRLKLYDDATRYFERTLALDADELLPKRRASALRSLASIKNSANDYPAALGYAMEARSIFEAQNNVRGVVSVDRTLSDIYKALEDIDKAMKYRQSALDLSIKINDKWSEASSLINLGELYRRSDIDKSRSNLLKGLDIANNLKTKSLQLDAFLGLMRTERSAKNYKESLSYLEAAYDLTQQLNSAEIDDRIAELKIIQETEKKERMIENLKRTKVINELELSKREAEVEILNKENAISNLELKQEKSGRIFFIGLTIIVALTLAFVYMRYRYSRQAEQTLNDRNVEIEKKNANLEELNLTKDRFFSIVSHDLRSPVSSIVSLAELLQYSLKDGDLEDSKKYAGAITEASNQTHELLEELLSWAIFQLQNADPLPRQHSARDVCKSTIQQLETAAKSKDITIDNEVSREETLFADRNIVSTVIRNLIANAIKFTPHNGSIRVFSEVKKDLITIHIKDSGVGISEKDQENIFRIDKLVSRKGTDGESGTGFGLSFCKNLIEKNNGQLDVVSESGKGSDFFLTLPRFVS